MTTDEAARDALKIELSRYRALEAGLLRAGFEIAWDYQPDDIPVRGNASATEDPEADKALEDEIIRRLDGGDVFAWMSATVKVTFKGVSGADSLGACSYVDGRDFLACCGREMLLNAAEEATGRHAEEAAEDRLTVIRTARVNLAAVKASLLSGAA